MGASESKQSQVVVGKYFLSTKELQKQLEASDEDTQKRIIEKWVEKSKKRTVTIVVVGKTGTGKSTLINSLIGRESAKVGYTLRKGTGKVTKHSAEINGVNFNAWDTPGLQDADEDTENDETLKQISDKIGNGQWDLLLFCIKMTEDRLTKDDRITIREVKNYFGEGVFRNAVFALTRANELTVPEGRKKISLTQYFNQRHSEWMDIICNDVLKDCSREITDNLMFVPTGYRQCSLPAGCEDWFSLFWMACLYKLKPEAQPALLYASNGRFAKCEDLVVKEEDLKEIPPQLRRIVVNRTGTIASTAKMLRVNKTALSGGMGVACGTCIGCLLGLIGGPMGASVGAVVGGAAGGGGGVLTYLLGNIVARYIGGRQSEESA